MENPFACVVDIVPNINRRFSYFNLSQTCPRILPKRNALNV